VKNRDELRFFYRRFPLLENNFAISATFTPQPVKRAKIDDRLRESQEKRRTTQPVARARVHFQEPRQHFPRENWVDELG